MKEDIIESLLAAMEAQLFENAKLNAALRVFGAELLCLAESCGQDKRALFERMKKMESALLQKELETIEADHPGLAARVDRRPVFGEGSFQP